MLLVEIIQLITSDNFVCSLETANKALENVDRVGSEATDDGTAILDFPKNRLHALGSQTLWMQSGQRLRYYAKQFLQRFQPSCCSDRLLPSFG